MISELALMVRVNLVGSEPQRLLGDSKLINLECAPKKV